MIVALPAAKITTENILSHARYGEAFGKCMNMSDSPSRNASDREILRVIRHMGHLGIYSNSRNIPFL
jgi:hypothetical protein